MDTNSGKLLAKEEVFQIVGCAIEVLNMLGHGLLEKPYENALAVEFGMRNIPFRQQPLFEVLYKGHKVGLFIPDLIAFDGCTLVFAEIKTRRIGGRQAGVRPDQRPLLGLGTRQRVRLRRLAAAWLREAGTRRPGARTIRFDAIGVAIDTRGRLRALEHVEAAW